MRRAVAAAAGAILATGAWLALSPESLPEGTERVWRVRWIDPNEEDWYWLQVCSRDLLGECDVPDYQSERLRRDGLTEHHGWVRFGGSVYATFRDISTESPESNTVDLEASVVAIRPEFVPEPGAMSRWLSGLSALALIYRRRAGRRRTTTHPR